VSQATAGATQQSGQPARVPAAVELEGVGFCYPGNATAALEGVSLRVAKGERLGILGPNGGGKSTLLKLILGLERPDRGTVRVFGESPEVARQRGWVGYVPQRPQVELGMPLSVREVVRLGAGWRCAPWRGIPAGVAERAERALELCGATGFADRPIGSLSGGQFQRAMMARALSVEPRILALDEPMVGIDPAGQAVFGELLREIHARLGLTLLIVSHDLRAIVAGADRVACLSQRLHSHTGPAGLTPEVLAEVFSHDLVGLAGQMGPLHVHAHAASACGHVHGSGAGPAGGQAAGEVVLTVTAEKKGGGGGGGSGEGRGG